MAVKIDKVIVTNNSALAANYDAAGFSAIHPTVKMLVDADGARGLHTQVVAVDDATAMTQLSVPAVIAAADSKQNKAAIDGICQS
jgi:hypothetical protein